MGARDNAGNNARKGEPDIRQAIWELQPHLPPQTAADTYTVVDPESMQFIDVLN